MTHFHKDGVMAGMRPLTKRLCYILTIGFVLCMEIFSLSLCVISHCC